MDERASVQAASTTLRTVLIHISVLLLGVGGLRWGEAAALRPADIDFLRRRVHLQRNAVMVSDGWSWARSRATRTDTVALPQFVIDALSVTAVKPMAIGDLDRAADLDVGSDGVRRPCSHVAAGFVGKTSRSRVCQYYAT